MIRLQIDDNQLSMSFLISMMFVQKTKRMIFYDFLYTLYHTFTTHNI